MFDSFKKRLWFLKIKLQDVGVMPKLTSKVMTYYKSSFSLNILGE